MAKSGFVVRAYSGRRLVHDRYAYSLEQATDYWLEDYERVMVTSAKIFKLPGFVEVAGWDLTPVSIFERPPVLRRRRHRP